MAKKTATKKRNPNDATFRNISALKTRVTALEAQLTRVWAAIVRLTDPLGAAKLTRR